MLDDGQRTDFRYTAQEVLSRRKAAELLTDLAYSLTAGGPIELILHGQRVAAAVPHALDVERTLKSKGDRMELRVTLRWVTPQDAAQPAAPTTRTADREVAAPGL